MEYFEYITPTLAVVAMVLLAVTGWVLTLLCMPGTWLIVVATAVYSYLVPNNWRIDIGWGTVAILLALAILGEILESLAVAVGAKRVGGSKRSAFLAICGSLGGALAGGLLGLPVPVVGSVIAIVLGAACGATAGAMLGEHWKGRSAEEGWEVGKAAFWGRLLGTTGKFGTATVMVALVVIALVIR